MTDMTETLTNHEHVFVPGLKGISAWKLINPIYWLQNGDNGWTAPLENNSAPYLPGETRQWVRNFYWWCRNPAANFMERIIGIELRDRTAYGPAPALAVTWRDVGRTGWKWCVTDTAVSLPWLAFWALCCAAIPLVSAWFVLLAMFVYPLAYGALPLISYAGKVEFYLGWRPHRGGFGIKLVKGAR